MDAIFLEEIRSDFPELRIVSGRKFMFRPPRTIIIDNKSGDSLLFLHEMGHFLCGHRSFKTELGRIKMEVQAWEKARELCLKYKIEANEERIEAELETYREWINQKSRCPECGLTRFQTPDGIWHCPMETD